MVNKTGSSRRRFMVGAAAAGAAASAVVALPQLQSGEQASVAPTQDAPKPERGGGYQLSEHVKQYYKTTLV